MNMELRHLRYFVAVAETLHFGRAAAQLYIAQSALSQQIKLLEAELEVTLFERTKRSVRLTAAGVALLEDAYEILQRVEQATVRSQRVARGEVGQLRIGYTILALHSILSPVLKAFRDRLPDVQLVLQEMSTQNQVKALETKQIDVGFLHPPIADAPALILRPMKTERMMVVLPQTHRLSKRKRVSVRQLKQEPLIIHPRSEGTVLYDQILQLYANIDCQPVIAQEAVTSPTRIGLVAAGLGITFVPEVFCNFSYAGVTYGVLKEAPILSYAVAWREEEPSPLVQALLGMC
jgi:DNA-binding transcriptional LysR family regulator